MNRTSGVTLAELLVVTGVLSVVVLVLIMGSISQRGAGEGIKERAAKEFRQTRAGFAATQLEKAIEEADRIVISTKANESSIRLRIPRLSDPAACVGVAPNPSCLNNAANYRWDQYSRSEAESIFLYYSDIAVGCPDPQMIAEKITSFEAVFDDAADPPPGGDPFSGEDNNAVAYEFDWEGDSAAREGQVFRGSVVSRAIAYTNVGAAEINEGGGVKTFDSGYGLAPADAVVPPACL